MIFLDITLAIVFVGALGALGIMVSEKLPRLAAVPDHVILAELERHAERMRLLTLPIKAFYQEKRYRDLFFNGLGKVVYRLHIFVMRMDNWLVLMLKFIQRYAKNGYLVNGNGNGNGEYWKKLQDDESATPVTPVAPLDSDISHHASTRPAAHRGSRRANRMIEVRTPRLFD